MNILRLMIHRLTLGGVAVALLNLSAVHATAAAGRGKPAVEPADNSVAALVRQLGDEQYSVRQAAQEQLARLGAEAFDALVAAESSEDVEIASRAAYLVHLIRIDLVSDNDSPQIKELLKDYESQPEDLRRQTMFALAEIPRDGGLAPLCRLIRFERSQLLSKQGAIIVLIAPQPAESQWAERAKTISAALKGSDRPASKWLLAYVQFHSDPEAALAAWDKLVTEELTAIDQNAPQLEAKIQVALLRRQAEMLLAQKHGDRATAVMRKIVDRQSDEVDSLIEFVEWLVKNKAWGVVDDVAKRFERTFTSNAKLLYTLAQARKVQGSEALAEQFAERAYSLNAAAEDVAARAGIADWLEKNGMRSWAEREFRFVISHGGAESDEVIGARIELSEILHDVERDSEAAETLKGLVDLLPKNGALSQRLTTLREPPKTLRSQMHYYLACAFAAKNDRARQIEELDLAIASDASDADVLIALYRLPDQKEDRRKQTLELIRDAAEQFRNELNDDPDQASVCNAYAWLIGNTEGDLDRALEYAHKAVELLPDRGGLLDTLAHCYAAKKDFTNAVKYQSRAAELDPHSQQIRKALDQYRQALDESQRRK